MDPNFTYTIRKLWSFNRFFKAFFNPQRFSVLRFIFIKTRMLRKKSIILFIEWTRHRLSFIVSDEIRKCVPKRFSVDLKSWASAINFLTFASLMPKISEIKQLKIVYVKVFILQNSFFLKTRCTFFSRCTHFLRDESFNAFLQIN